MPGKYLPYDHDTATKAIAAFTLEYLTMSRYGDPNKVSPDVLQAINEKLSNAMGAGISAIGEVERLRGLIAAQRQIHLPMPSTVPGLAVVCQACSLGGTPVPWKCGVWEFADQALADGPQR